MLHSTTITGQAAEIRARRARSTEQAESYAAHVRELEAAGGTARDAELAGLAEALRGY